MSHKRSIGFSLPEIIGTGIGFLMYFAALVIPWLLAFLYGWAREPVTYVLRLQTVSVYWRHIAWFCKPILWIGSFLSAALLAIGLFQLVEKPFGSASLSIGLHNVLQGLALAFPVAIVKWIRDLSSDSGVQRRLAGNRAEKAVARLLNATMGRWPGCQVLHNQLYVFHKGTDQEFSVEVDHLVVVTGRIYVIETKFKSGTIWASANASEWRTASKRGEGTMRNALDQAKNAARVLERELSLPEVLPMVVIVGRDTLLVGAPGNVVALGKLIETLDAFEQCQPAAGTLPVREIVDRLTGHSRSRKTAMARHIERAEAAKQTNHLEKIVQTASLR